MPASTGMWDATYRKFHLGGICDPASVEITTAISDRLELVSDLEIRVRAGQGMRAHAYAEIRLSANEMRKLAEMLETAADRVDELETLRDQSAQFEEAA